MLKKIILTLSTLWMVSCSAHDEHYFTTHPQALQSSLHQCEMQNADDAKCQKLKAIASRLNDLALQLRSNPQDFGKQILVLQQTVAQQEAGLQKDGNQSELKASLSKNKRQLNERLAVVKWLESPES